MVRLQGKFGYQNAAISRYIVPIYRLADLV